KKEQLELSREIDRLNTIVGGMERLDKLPDVLFIVDIKKEKTAMSEALRKKTPVVAICDTNVNPELVDYPIPGNDDAISSVKLLVGLVAEAVNEAREEGAAIKQ
ncbi:MAG: 30S ribosomal protein S2, partial [Patescibacteria group bacterium]